MLTVHHLNSSRSQRVLWLLEELGAPYEVVKYERQPDLRAPPELRAVHPLGKAPVLTDGDRVVAESAVILEYLLDTRGEGRLRPAGGTTEFERYRYWMHYAEGSAMTPLLLSLIFNQIPKQPMPIFVRPIAAAIAERALAGFVNPQIKLHLEYLEVELSARPWFAGNAFTAADVQMSFPIEAAATRARDFARGYPNLRNFVERIRARPAYQRAEARVGSFSTLG